MKKQTKTAFVLAHPNLPGAEVVKEAAKQGLKMSIAYVYSVRSKAKATVGQPRRSPGRPPKASPATATSGSLDKRFMNLALDLGLGRAEALLKGVRAMART
jgi:hypothetical protein